MRKWRESNVKLCLWGKQAILLVLIVCVSRAVHAETVEISTYTGQTSARLRGFGDLGFPDYLQQVPDLDAVYIYWPQIGLEDWRSMSKLHSVKLIAVEEAHGVISKDLLQSLRSNSKLTSLILPNFRVDISAIPSLQSLKNLRGLTIAADGVSEPLLTKIADLPNLHGLTISGTVGKVSAKSIQSIVDSTSHKSFRITIVSKGSIKVYSRATPEAAPAVNAP